MNLITLPADTIYTAELVKKIIDKTALDTAKYETLERYYEGKHTSIALKQKADGNTTNNKITNPYPQYITDTLSGYMVGEPITYTHEDEEINEWLNEVLTSNHTPAQDMGLARDMSIYGVAYEILYIDEAGQPKYQKISPKEIIQIRDDSIEGNLSAVIRKIDCYDIIKDEHYSKVEVYTDRTVIYMEGDQQYNSLHITDEKPHYFSTVPVVIYQNNEKEIGDYETIISLIDAYDRLESNSVDDNDYFNDAYMIIKGDGYEDEEELKKIANGRLMVVRGDASIEYLTKESNDNSVENLKTRINKDIHKFAKVPDLSDENFASNASGIAIKFKLYGTETLISNKEQFFRKALERRLMLIFDIANLKGGQYNYKEVDIQFTRNIPNNETEIADTIQKLASAGVVSKETLCAQVPFVTDVTAEMDKVAEEKDENPFYTFNFDTPQEVKEEE